MKEERRYYLWLAFNTKIGPGSMKKLLQLFPHPSELFHADEEVLDYLADRQVISQDALETMKSTRTKGWIYDYEKLLMEKKVRYITLADTEYPSRLKAIYDPPVTLFCKGDISLMNREFIMGVVGSRTPSIYGSQMTAEFVQALSEQGIVIVSGLAAGIDGAAHKNALLTGGKTIGVIGGGIDSVYPQMNYRLYEEMEKSQLILSEYGPGEKPMAYRFPMRNRIISGLSDGILVIEARKKSGTLITADCALDQNKSVYALPGRVGDSLSEGTNNLIRQGAMIVTSPEEIVKDITGIQQLQVSRKKTPGLSEREERIQEVMDYTPITPDELMEITGLSLSDVLEGLILLEQRKMIRRVSAGSFVKEINQDVYE